MNTLSAPAPCRVCSRPMGRAVRCPWCGESAPERHGTTRGLLLCALTTTLALPAPMLRFHAFPFVPERIQSVPLASPALPSLFLVVKPHLPWMAILLILLLVVRPHPGPHWLQDDLRRRTHLRNTSLGLCIAAAFGTLGLVGGRLATLQPPTGFWNPIPLAIFLGTLGLNFQARRKESPLFRRIPGWGMLLLGTLLSMNLAGIAYLGACAAAFGAGEKLETDPRMPLLVILLPLALNAPGLVFPG